MKDSETKNVSVEHPLSMHRTASNEIINMINEENGIIAQVQGKKPVSILNDKFCDEQGFFLSSF